MDAIKKLAIILMALFPLLAVTAVADEDHGFTSMVIFGDSLSDPGNRFAVTGGTANPPFIAIPSEAYGVGGHHFSNGRTWVEVMAQAMNLNTWAKPASRNSAFGNYAYGGARARPYSPTAPSFTDQVQSWLANHGCSSTPLNDTLFVIQFGGNDLRDVLEAPLTGEDPTPIIPGAIMAIVQNIGVLKACGARNFLVANVPNLGATPLVPDGAKPLVTAVAAQFNAGLEQALAAYHWDINRGTLDLFGFVTNMTAPGSLFENTSAPCLTFGVTANAFCKNRDSYFFWDAIHPTKKAHAYLAEFALGALPEIN